MMYTEAGPGPYISGKLTEGPIDYQGLVRKVEENISAARNSRALDLVGISAEWLGGCVLAGPAIRDLASNGLDYTTAVPIAVGTIAAAHAINRVLKHVRALEYGQPFVDVAAE